MEAEREGFRQPGGAEAGDGGRVARRAKAAEDPRGAGRGEFGGDDVVLDRNRNMGERAVRGPFAGGEKRLPVEGDEGVEVVEAGGRANADV